MKGVEVSGVLRPAAVASIRGRLQFTMAQCFGRAGALGLKLLGDFEKNGKPLDAKGEQVQLAFGFWCRFFLAARPR